MRKGVEMEVNERIVVVPVVPIVEKGEKIGASECSLESSMNGECEQH